MDERRRKLTRSYTRVGAVSLLVHLLLVAGLTWHRRVWVAPVRLPGTARGTQMVLTYLPGAGAASRAAIAPRHVRIAPRVVQTRSSPLLPPLAPVPVESASATTTTRVGASMDALGEGDISIALMQFFPDPKPDLSRLPHGSRGDVVLEAVIDAGGRITQLTVKQGVGYGVDESVVATVQQWTFHPAVRDGKPIASQQEFHFHFERG